MAFRPEPTRQHGTLAQTAVVLVNLGTPDAPTPGAVRRYLREFLSDPRVVEIPRAVWSLILNLFILPFRPRKSAAKYASIWTEEGSPLMVYTERQVQQMRRVLAQRGHSQLRVEMAMRYGSPSLPSVLDKLKAEGADRILILPAYPQYAGSTTASVNDAVFAHYLNVRNVPELRLVKHYHDHDAYLDALASSVRAYWDQHGRGQKLVMSFHGVPKHTLLKGDPYHCECHKTARLLAERLRLTPEQYVVTFQSRFGKAEWLQPYTQATIEQLARDGTTSIDVICPGFIADCLETLEEIQMEVRQAFLVNGGKRFNYIPCLNDSAEGVAALVEIAEQHMIGWPTMLTPAQREADKRDAEASKARAAAIGASA